MKKVSNPKPKDVKFSLHTIPEDLKFAIESDPKVQELWKSLTPLSRNEWICWVTIVKKPETRLEHIERVSIDLLRGKRRPCCWPGCPHRNPKAAKYFKPKPKNKI